MIPKRIFYVWGANEKKPRDVQVCIETWRQIMPDYEIIEINENDTKYFNFQKELENNKWFRTVYENKLFAYISDYIRIKVLYEHGGIYFDTDVSALKPLDKFLKNEAFVGMQNTKLVEPAILGANKHNRLLYKVLQFYNEKNKYNIWNLPIYTMPDIFEHVFKRYYNIFDFPEKNKQKIIKTKDITIYPERYFIPFRYGSSFTPDCVEKDTCTIHWFGGSWTKESVRYWLTHKHIEPIDKLNKMLFSDVASITRLSVIGNKTVIKIIKFTNGKLKVSLFHFIPLLRTSRKHVYLFNFLPVLKIKH